MEDYLKYDGRLPEPPYETECDSCDTLRAEMEAQRLKDSEACIREIERLRGLHCKQGDTIAALHAELVTLKAKVRELDAWLLKDRIMIAGEADNQTDAYAAMRRALSAKLRELGLITGARDGE